MPTYTYECTNENCKHQFEIIQRMNESHIANCPRCGVLTDKQIYSATNTLWKCDGAFGKSK